MDNLLENKYIVSAITAYLVTSTGLLNPIIPEELLKFVGKKRFYI